MSIKNYFHSNLTASVNSHYVKINHDIHVLHSKTKIVQLDERDIASPVVVSTSSGRVVHVPSVNDWFPVYARTNITSHQGM